MVSGEEERELLEREDVALVRIEQLFPLHLEKIQKVIDRYPNIEEYIWAQEEPANMGAWTYMFWQMHQKLTLVSPVPSASTASGSNQIALQRQRETIERVFSI